MAALTVIFPGSMSVTAKERGPVRWFPVDESEWAIYMDAPAYHCRAAGERLKAGDTAAAREELSKARVFLEFQKQHLSESLRAITGLEERLGGAGTGGPAAFDSVISATLNAVGRKYLMVPVDVQNGTFITDAHLYHLEQARKHIEHNKRKEAADEIRRAAAFLKVKGAYMGITPWSKVETSVSALNKLAADIESGKVKEFAALEKAYADATAVFASEIK